MGFSLVAGPAFAGEGTILKGTNRGARASEGRCKAVTAAPTEGISTALSVKIKYKSSKWKETSWRDGSKQGQVI